MKIGTIIIEKSFNRNKIQLKILYHMKPYLPSFKGRVILIVVITFS